jgi:hypothetical protein
VAVAGGVVLLVIACPVVRLIRGVRWGRLHSQDRRRTIDAEEVMRMADSSMNIDAPSTSVGSL